jgi:hypothetical protein
MKIYSHLIIGSGPSSLGFLLGKSKLKNSLLLSSKSIKNYLDTAKHPKIISNNQSFIKITNSNFGVTTNLGGLTSSWGGVLVILNKDKILKFTKYKNNFHPVLEAYKTILLCLKNFFTIYKHTYNKINIIKDSKQITANGNETYILGSNIKYGWEKGALNLYPLIKSECKRLQIPIFTGEAIKIDKVKKMWRVKCSDSKIFFTKNLILAAGGIGNHELLKSYTSDFNKVILNDHIPLKIIGFKFFSLKYSFLKKDFSTPISSISRDLNNFYVTYSLIKLSELFIKKLGFKGFLFLKMPGFIKEKIIFIQYWNMSLLDSIFSKSQKYPFNAILKALFFCVKNKVIPMHIEFTKKGEGYHYISNTNPDLLKQLFTKHNKLTILGGLTNNFSSNEHPTLTFMADAYIQSRFKKN